MTVASTTSTDARGRRPGGRSARVQDAVYRAVGTLVSTGFRETMTIPQVAEAAGVNPTSIYRRWGSVDVLLEEVAVAALTRDEPLPDTGNLPADLDAWAVIIAEDIARPHRVAYLRALVSARDDGGVETCPCWETRRAQAGQMIDRARDRGERVPEPRQVLDHMVAPLYHHAVFGLPIDADYARVLVTDVLRMAAAPN
ncbi:TetR/AcrR family transcriptional regulator [Williamsia sterculiae]|uniref:Transcriptional regulator, TetR family n=1 Tax=Williamsia sterculiae TaxID=1344003 RepID=A0A1N7EZG3_9NOCA|nr:TetR/AcrR family transcriptional regulator [Williamsia sterculiae]SIR93476.1 transcriptional regulator, TetR family [Williamsia sterculiae]